MAYENTKNHWHLISDIENIARYTCKQMYNQIKKWYGALSICLKGIDLRDDEHYNSKQIYNVSLEHNM